MAVGDLGSSKSDLHGFGPSLLHHHHRPAVGDLESSEGVLQARPGFRKVPPCRRSVAVTVGDLVSARGLADLDRQ